MYEYNYFKKDINNEKLIEMMEYPSYFNKNIFSSVENQI